MKRLAFKSLNQRCWIRWDRGTKLCPTGVLSVELSGRKLVGVFPLPRKFFKAVLRDIAAMKAGRRYNGKQK